MPYTKISFQTFPLLTQYSKTGAGFALQARVSGSLHEEGFVRKLVFSGLALGLLLSAPTRSLAQAVYGSIVGTVTDDSGAGVPKSKVTVVDTGKGVSYSTTTNESGNYSQQHL